ncbi:MAG: tol-pal system protein YbgF [Aestuariivita sp.]|nr:tol-pal system protein YbgF [Aestuariivita sp.]
MRHVGSILLCFLFVAVSSSGSAQTENTLADIRQELNVLYVEIQRLKRELSTTGGPEVPLTGGSVLERVQSMEAELQRLTAQTEQLNYRIERIVHDGTNRIGDLEFRLVELEGGDINQLGETTTLGGKAATTSSERAQPSENIQLAIGEQVDFDTAVASFDAADYPQAITLFEAFNRAYPGSPLAAEAHLLRGKALRQTNDTQAAARAFLNSYTASSQEPIAPEAIFQLGIALGDLGNKHEACVTLGEVGVRFPRSPFIEKAAEQMIVLECR